MIKVGILGTGFGKVHADIYKKLEGVEIAGIFGRTSEKLDEIKNELKVRVTNNIDELINDPSIDLIDVCLPTSMHKKYVIKSLMKNKNVLCETPICYTLEEAEEMKRYAKKYNKKLFVDLFFKFSDPHRIATEKIKSNALGKPLVIKLYQKTPPHWGDMDLDRITHNFMLHNFDFLTDLIGLPTEVIANGFQDKNSYVFSTLKYKNGMASVESSTMLPKIFPFNIGFDIICEFGTITFDGKYGQDIEQKFMIYKDNKKEEIDLPSNNDHEQVIKYVINNINNNESNSVISIDEAIKSLKIVLAIKQSLKNNCAVSIK
ncbi:MAG: Gfo/Idh/MocA family oxidoreductase [Firmicutes bacterium]|nr:Gfo/Idh/MocA family oxidoreductase [Bacillota bacterium]